MYTFKQYIDENTVIKLGSKRSDSVDAFMKDFHDTTTEHPFHRSARIVGNATVEASPDGHQVHIHDIVSLAPKTGAGTEALKHMTGLADKHGVKLNLFAKAYAKQEPYLQNTKKLASWYKKHGFQHDEKDWDPREGSDMTYYPK